MTNKPEPLRAYLAARSVSPNLDPNIIHTMDGVELRTEQIRALIAEVERKEAENERLKGALEPLEKLWRAAQASYEGYPDSLGFYGYNGVILTVGHLRNAAAALSEGEE